MEWSVGLGWLTLFIASLSAPLSRRRVTVAWRPIKAAQWRAVRPSYNRDTQTGHVKSGQNVYDMYYSMSIVVWSGWLWWLTLSFASISAPLFRRRVTQASSPPKAAFWRAVNPSYNRDTQTGLYSSMVRWVRQGDLHCSSPGCWPLYPGGGWRRHPPPHRQPYGGLNLHPTTGRHGQTGRQLNFLGT